METIRIESEPLLIRKGRLAEICRGLLGVGLEKIDKWPGASRLKTIHRGKSTYYRRADIKAWFEKLIAIREAC